MHMSEAGLFKNITMLSLEQATVLPYLSYRLALDGVKVIRIEHPVYGDPNRMIGGNVLGEERLYSYFLPINCEKKAITLDMGTPEGKGLLKELVVKLKADIFATNQLPRNYDKLGISYEALKALKEDLIWVGITGFGPNSNEAAYDPILQARSGLMELTGEAEGSPEVVGVPLPDMGTSEHAYGQVMKALFQRAVSGVGSRIDVVMMESSLSWLTVPITLTSSFGNKISRRGNTHEFFAPVSVYETKDGFVYIAVGNDRQWETLTKIPGFESLAQESYLKNKGRIADLDNLNRRLNEITKKFSADEIIRTFNQATIAISKVQTIPEVIADPYVKPLLLHSKDPKSGKEITLAPAPYRTPYLESIKGNLQFPPRFGEHNEEVYCGMLGHSAADLREFKEKGII
jgi:crotonobetainyl-CoA:carnitine CoA-transferase CaiB-like acyl-CoA transferase